MNGKKRITFDIETTGLNPWYGAQITCICARTQDGESFSMASEQEDNILECFVNWLSYREQETFFLLSKNGKMFDVPFIIARALILGLNTEDFLELLDYDHFDLQGITKKWISLDDMARILRCEVKSGTGLDAIRLFKEGKLEDLEAYCMQDVNVTEQVFLRRGSI